MSYFLGMSVIRVIIHDVMSHDWCLLPRPSCTLCFGQGHINKRPHTILHWSNGQPLLIMSSITVKKMFNTIHHRLAYECAWKCLGCEGNIFTCNGWLGRWRLFCQRFQWYATQTIVSLNDKLVSVQKYQNVFTMYIYYHLWITSQPFQLVNIQMTHEYCSYYETYDLFILAGSDI